MRTGGGVYLIMYESAEPFVKQIFRKVCYPVTDFSLSQKIYPMTTHLKGIRQNSSL